MFGNLNTFESSLLDGFRRMEQEMDQIFGNGLLPSGIRSVARGTYPPINIGGTADQVDVYIFAAGLDTKSLDISIQKNLLSVSGKREATDNKEASEFYRKERFAGEFHRVITLPEDVDSEKVDASYKDGVLRISVQRHESAKPRQIKIS